MKRLMTGLSAVFGILIFMIAPASAQVTSFWHVDISEPAVQSTRTFNVQYTVLSTEVDTFMVSLFQNGIVAPLQSENTSVDPNAINGNSGAFTVTVLADGDYVYYLTASRDGSTDPLQTTPSISVHVDTTAPAAPTYHGKARVGNTYTLSFTAPADTDVKHVQIFASTATTYQAGDSTRVGDVVVAPNQLVSFSYTAPDATTRYFALEAFDAAGNGSVLVGDPGTVVNPVQLVTTTTTGATPNILASSNLLGTSTTTAATTGTEVTSTTPSGQVDASGATSTTAPTNVKVLGAQVTKKNPISNAGLWIGGAVLLALVFAIAYYAITRKQGSKS